MSLETRSNSALIKRAEQLKRWQDSETFREPGEPRSKNRRIGFSDGCVFLAACAAGDRDEVKQLLGRGADIDTANVDGLTALHQACIDDNLDMVEFLVANGADVDRGDNEGWTPLHATASCGFLSIARFLLDHGSNVAAVNNDGELAIDISESDEMEELLQKEIDAQKVNCDEARNREEQYMLDDARDWKNSGKLGDRPHHKTGATALHVAAAKGYTKVMSLLIQAGCEVNQQDFDGWTPLHAAAHWAQREACELLTDAYVNMDIKNCVGQTPFDVADPDVLRLLEELKKKQNNCSKDRPDIRALITRPPTTPGLGKGGRSANPNNSSMHADVIRGLPSNNGTNNANAIADRSSITRLSQQEKVHSTREITAKETIKEEKANILDASESDRESNTDTSESESSLSERLTDPALDALPYDDESRPRDSPGVVVTDESGKEAQPSFLPPHPEVGQGIKLKIESSIETIETSSIDQLEKANVELDELGKDDGSAPWRRPGSLRARPTASGMSGKLSPSSEDLVTVRRAHSFGSDEKRRISEDISKQSPDLRPRSQENLAVGRTLPAAPAPAAQVRRSSDQSLSNPTTTTATSLAPDSTSNTSASNTSLPTENGTLPNQQGITNMFKTFFNPIKAEVKELVNGLGSNSNSSKPQKPGDDRGQPWEREKSFVPPVRDEEHEIQRKAHAKRVRETRRSTQGVTLEDLKSAEQLVKKKQQQENATRTTELQQLASAGPPSPPTASPSPASTHPSTTATTTVTTSATLNLQVGPSTPGGRVEEQDRGHERRPSWRLRIESGDKSRFTLEDTVREGVVSSTPPTSSRLSHNPNSNSNPVTSSHPSPTEQRRTSRLEAARSHALHHQGESETPGSPTTGLTAVQRKKKPKRRSTGVLSAEDIEPRSEESADENGASPTHDTHETSPLKSNLKTNGGGQVDYKKLWEESQEENSRLRSEMEATRLDLDSTRQQLDSAIQVLAKNSVSDIEKREKKVLEKKLGEMEDELKQLQKLKSENEKLKSENRALTRVVSKLTSAASKAVPATPGPVNRK